MPIASSLRLKRKNRNLFELLPGYSCNANCRFCSIDPIKRNINSTTHELLQNIYKAKEDGFKYLGIGGGEPTIRKDLSILISSGKKLKFDVIRIETNGIALSYLDYCRSLVDAGLDFVKMSIHGYKPEIHDFLTRVPGSFEKVLKAIDNLQRLKVRIEINTVINKINYKFYRQFVNFFAQKGIGSFCLIYPLYTGRMAENWREIGISVRDVAPYLKEVLDLIDSLELDKGIVFNILPCCLLSHEDKIVGYTLFNTKVTAPDITIENVDYNQVRAKIKLATCKNCIYFNNCGGVRCDYLKFFGDKEFKPVYEKRKQ